LIVKMVLVDISKLNGSLIDDKRSLITWREPLKDGLSVATLFYIESASSLWCLIILNGHIPWCLWLVRVEVYTSQHWCLRYKI